MLHSSQVSYRVKAHAFLNSIWIVKKGHAFIGTKSRKTGAWRDHPIDMRNGLRDVTRTLLQYSREDYDLYFTPNRFSKPVRKKEFGLPTDLGWCDIDQADPEEFRPLPSIVIRTSPGSYQGIWKWDKCVSPAKAEAYSHALTYRYGGDPGGWSITKYLRLPYTYNHKKEYNLPRVLLLEMNLKPITGRPKLVQGVNLGGSPKTEGAKTVIALHHKWPNSIVSKYKFKIHSKTRSFLLSKKAYAPDRSKWIYMMIADLHKAGASREEIATCLWSNPYFVEKHGQNVKKLNEEIHRVISKQ